MAIDEQNEELLKGIKDILDSFMFFQFPSLAPPKAKKLGWEGAPKAMIKLFKKHSTKE